MALKKQVTGVISPLEMEFFHGDGVHLVVSLSQDALVEKLKGPFRRKE